MTRQPTRTQSAVLNFIREEIIRGVAPTMQEIASYFGYSSPHAAAGHVSALAKKGLLVKLPGTARGILLPKQPDPFSDAALWQQFPAMVRKGQP